MKLDIQLSHNQIFNCFEDCIIMVLSAWGFDYELAFAESWYFSLEPLDEKRLKTLGLRIHGVPKGWVPLTQYFGINLIFHEKKASSEILDIIRQELSIKHPLILSIDAYWCPWDMSYQSLHEEHVFLITGLNEVNKDLNCIDGYYMKDNQVLPFENLEKGYSALITFWFEGNKVLDFSWCEIVEIALNNLYDNSELINSFDSIRKFATEINSSLNLDLEFKGYKEGIWQAPILRNIKFIINGRKKFVMTLEYLGRKFNREELFMSAEKLKQVTFKWSQIQNMLIKLYFQKRTLSNRIADFKDKTVKATKMLQSSFWRSLFQRIIRKINYMDGKIMFLNRIQQFKKRLLTFTKISKQPTSKCSLIQSKIQKMYHRQGKKDLLTRIVIKITEVADDEEKIADELLQLLRL